MATKKQVQIDLKLNDKETARKFKDLSKEVGNTEEALEDAESAGKTMAKVIEQSADQMIDEIDRTKRAVDALERSLGPDFDADTRDVVADLKRLGLTAEDIEQDADELAAALRRAGDVNVKATEAGFRDLDQAMGNTQDEIGRTGDTMHGFIGGTVGELPLISESMGPIAEGLGQLTEGALAGEVNFKQLALAGGAMMGVGFVLNKVNAQMTRIKENKAWKTEQVDAYADSLDDATSAAEAVANKLRDAEELTLSFGQGMFEFDALPMLNAAGVSVDEFSRLVAGGIPTIDAWAAQMEAAGVPLETYGPTVALAKQETEFFAQAQEAAAVTAQFFGTEQENAEVKVKALNESIRVSTERITANMEAEQNAADAKRARTDVVFAARDAEDALHDALARSDEVLADSEATERDKAAALRDTTSATDDYTRKTMEAEGIIVDSADGQREYTRRMMDTAKFLGGPMERELLEYIAIQNGIPEEKLTWIQTELDKGNVEGARLMIEQELSQAEAKPTVTPVGMEAARTRIEWILGRELRVPLTADLHVPARRGQGSYNARGTTYWKGGRTWVGEEGPELVDLPKGAAVHPADRSRRMADGQGQTIVNNVTQYFPAGVRPNDVIAAQQKYTQVQGPT